MNARSTIGLLTQALHGRAAGLGRCGVVAAAALHLCVPAAAQVGPTEPRTPAERVNFERTSAHDELLAYLFEVQSRSDRMLVEELAVTNEGRVMPLVILGAPPPGDPGAAFFSGKPTVFFTGSVHGNERAGKEGTQILIRELALGRLRPLLDRVNVLIVPSLNPDGAERPGRTNSLGYDMNRDFIVAETPEISAVLEQILTRWWPDVYVDVHNGGAYPYNVTYQATLHPGADAELVAFARGPMHDAVAATLAEKDMKMFWYSGPRRDQETGEYVWTTTEPWARKQHTYGGLQNMVTLLFEIPGRWTLAQQADNARTAMEGLLRFVADNAAATRQVVLDARRRAVAVPAEVVIEVEAANHPEPERFLVMEGGGRGGRGGGAGGAQAAPQEREVTGYVRTLYVPTETRPAAWAYAFDGRLDDLAALLRRHAITVEQLAEPATADVERYRLTQLEWDTQPYQNHLLASADVELASENAFTLPAGTYVVRSAQAAGRLVGQILEPDTEDSILAWNFLDHSLSGARNAVSAGRVVFLPIYRIPRPAAIKALVVR